MKYEPFSWYRISKAGTCEQVDSVPDSFLVRDEPSDWPDDEERHLFLFSSAPGLHLGYSGTRISLIGPQNRRLAEFQIDPETYDIAPVDLGPEVREQLKALVAAPRSNSNSRNVNAPPGARPPSVPR